ncbi:MAG: class I SAM-dependent methyltransferase [Candidatus Doudnabacteria bacterium]|nr:class I SAM-dependent methyltransferase [Candidatus Doudnabacteria bacterium]
MQVLDKDTKFAHLGKPGGAFTPGFRRRLNKLMSVLDLRDKKILDVGCGEGVWLAEFAKLTAPENVFGSEYDSELVAEIVRHGSDALVDSHIPLTNIVNCPAEALQFADNTFDIVFSHEVLEHVQDDAKAVSEAIRVLRPGGYFVVFTPNRGWPFEQHGMFWWGKYYWGNIPLLPWFPWLYRIFAPHVRNYWWWDIRRLMTSVPGVQIYKHDFVFPAFDRLKYKWGGVGKLIQQTFYALEHTPLRVFGISHLIIVQKPT